MLKSQSHSWAANLGSPNNSSWRFLHSSSLSGWTNQGKRTGKKSFSWDSALTHIWWNQFPVPLGVDNIIAPPPVAKVCWAAPQVSPTLSMKAASSINSKDTASDLAASVLEDFAWILEPFLSFKDNLLFSTSSIFNHEGKFSYINCTLETKFRAVA